MSRAAGFAGIAASATVAESLPIRQSIPASSAVCATGRWSVCPLPSAGGQAEFRLSRHGAGGGADCIFTDWAGDFSPIGAYHSSVVNVVDCTFRNMYLSAEIVDVSNDGIVRFQDALLANATLQYGNVVGTTTNDGTKADGFDLEYYDTDDDAFDVKLTPAPTSDRETSGVEFTIDESTLSDCLYLRAPTGFVMPGCPEASIQARAAVLQRDPAAGASAVAEDPSEVWNPGGRLDDLLLDGDSPWLQARQAELGPLPSAAVTGWPEFVLPPMRNLVNRTDVTRPRQELPDGELLGAFRRTPQAVNRTAAVLAAAALRGPIVVRPLREEVWQPRLVALVAVLAVAAAVAAAAAAWAALALRRDARERRDNQAARAAARQMDGDLLAGMVRPWYAVFMHGATLVCRLHARLHAWCDPLRPWCDPGACGVERRVGRGRGPMHDPTRSTAKPRVAFQASAQGSMRGGVVDHETIGMASRMLDHLKRERVQRADRPCSGVADSLSPPTMHHSGHSNAPGLLLGEHT